MKKVLLILAVMLATNGLNAQTTENKKQCSAQTSKKKRCIRNAVKGKDVCWQHTEEYKLKMAEKKAKRQAN